MLFKLQKNCIKNKCLEHCQITFLFSILYLTNNIPIFIGYLYSTMITATPATVNKIYELRIFLVLIYYSLDFSLIY